MNMNQLKYVLTVANSSSLREAAMKLYISQPALSLSISELENELGIVLFERSNRGIGLTDAGREFITYAKKVLGQYEILEDRYLSRNKDKERFSVSTQHYNFAIRLSGKCRNITIKTSSLNESSIHSSISIQPNYFSASSTIKSNKRSSQNNLAVWLNVHFLN